MGGKKTSKRFNWFKDLAGILFLFVHTLRNVTKAVETFGGEFVEVKEQNEFFGNSKQ